MVRIVLRAKGGHVREGSCVVCWWGFNYSTLERRVEVKTILVYLPPFEGNRKSGGTDLGHMLLQWREQLKIVSLIASSWACLAPASEGIWLGAPPHIRNHNLNMLRITLTLTIFWFCFYETTAIETLCANAVRCSKKHSHPATSKSFQWLQLNLYHNTMQQPHNALQWLVIYVQAHIPGRLLCSINTTVS